MSAPENLRGAVAAGLVAHGAEKQQRPSGRYIWDLGDRGIPYAP